MMVINTHLCEVNNHSLMYIDIEKKHNAGGKEGGRRKRVGVGKGKGVG